MKLTFFPSRAAQPSRLRVQAASRRTNPSGAGRPGNPQAGRLRYAERGIALVVTLILLSVITFLTVAFLFLSRRERGSVATTVEQSVAKYATEAAVERAKTEMAALILATTNRNAYGLRVSTNYFNGLGFDPAPPAPARVDSLTNVNYDYRIDGANVAGNDLLQNIANLYYSPRPPVYIQTNRNFPNAPLDFRYWLDLNRNGVFDPNGMHAEINPNGGYYDTNGNLIPFSVPAPANTRSNFYVGDPEWVGILDRTDRPHGPNNKFVSRFAYVVVPSGKTLDLNFIHNQVREANNAPFAAGEGFSRNMGFGTWEFNLASFLVDLNTNIWCPDPSPLVVQNYYQYYLEKPFNPNPSSVGVAFDDALRILRYRYGSARGTGPLSVSQVLPAGVTAFESDGADGFGFGLPLMYGTRPPAVDPDLGRTGPAWRWPGSDSTNHFTSMQELYDDSKVGLFADRLHRAGTNSIGSYDRYTFYRLLSQMGVETGPEQPTGKIHLNYNNTRLAATNFVPWTAVEFFTNAADRLLRAQFSDPNFNAQLFGVRAPLSLTNIPVLISNRFVYTPSLHRLLQVAANIYDASTNRTYAGATEYPFLPTVFRPRFTKVPNGSFTDVYISDFAEVTETWETFSATHPLRDLTKGAQAAAALQPDDRVYGVPLVIGAKKGLPNFNEFAMESFSEVTRRLQLRRPTITSRPNGTNVMFTVGISNAFAFEAWNSYISNYTRTVDIFVTNIFTLTFAFTNDIDPTLDTRGSVRTIGPLTEGRALTVPAGFWRGTVNPLAPRTNSFLVPLTHNTVALSNAIFRPDSGLAFPFVTATNQGANLFFGFENTGRLYNPQFNLSVSNQILFVMVDRPTGRIIDYVHLTQLDANRDLSRELATATPDSNGAEVFWQTNRYQGNTLFHPPEGVRQQILASRDIPGAQLTEDQWTSYQRNPFLGNDRAKATALFNAFMNGSPTATNLVMQAPFTPTRRVSLLTSWQANDPLVHYMANDLVYAGPSAGIRSIPNNVTPTSLKGVGDLNIRWEPWSETRGEARLRRNLAVKDPLIYSSDYWDFPANKFPNVGWLGRVHRGTPWQTIYLKSSDVDSRTWTNWSGNTIEMDAMMTRPIADRVLFDVFTTAFNDNATRGQLNVNQEGLAAWSAALGGLIALTNVVADSALNVSNVVVVNPIVIAPVGTEPTHPTNSALWKIWAGINRTRADTNTFPKGFGRTGDVLATPELTVESPLLNRSDAQRERGIDDATYERIPQMLMGLLRGNEAPRFTIYAYGQALKPAPRSIVPSGPYAGLCTNYQITAEFATRTVVRMDVEMNSAGRLEPRAVIESYNILGPE